MLESISASIATGVKHPESRERNTIEELTGWDGTINRGMFGSLVDIPKQIPHEEQEE